MLRSLFIQSFFFISIFLILSWFQSTDMLDKGKEINHQHQITTLKGEQISLNAQGQQTLLYFFAPWCNVCHLSIENLQNIYEGNRKLKVIAIALDYSSIKEVNAFVWQHQLTFPIALGNEEIKQQYNIQGYPSYYILNEDNIITARSIGYSTELGIYIRTL